MISTFVFQFFILILFIRTQINNHITQNNFSFNFIPNLILILYYRTKICLLLFLRICYLKSLAGHLYKLLGDADWFQKIWTWLLTTQASCKHSVEALVKIQRCYQTRHLIMHEWRQYKKISNTWILYLQA